MRGEMFVEGIHMSDYGMMTYADAYEPMLRRILRRELNRSRNK